jgi:Mg-chelatase subunit ChlD
MCSEDALTDMCLQAQAAAQSSSTDADRAMRNWKGAAMALTCEIDHLTEVLEEAVLPCNRYTRRQAALKGSQLHLPGLMKAACTDYRYKKIFSTRTAGGTREYGIALVVDVSQSMDGHKIMCAMSALVMFVEALGRLRLENFSIVLFGETVELVKAPTQEWDSGAVLSLLQRVLPQRHATTRDADAVLATAALLAALRGPKKAFVLTDGFTSSGAYLAHALHYCEQQGIQVAAVSVGIEASNVGEAYTQWVCAALPRTLPEALRELFGGEESEDGHHARVEDVSASTSTLRMRGLHSDDAMEETKESILAQRWERFKRLHELLKEDRKANLVRGDTPENLVVDVALVIDCTGSMAAALGSVKAQLRAMLIGPSSIPERVKQQYPGLSLTLRCALLGFRDTCDSPQFIEPMASSVEGQQHFYANMESFAEQVDDLQAIGGGDLCEDSPQALLRAVEWGDWAGHARFLLLITDAPCHGSSYHNNIQDDDPQTGTMQSTINLDKAFAGLIEKDIALVLCQCDQGITDLMVTRMRDMLTHKLVLSSSDGKAPPRADRHLCSVRMVDATGDASRGEHAMGAVHHIFVLDSSSSMHPYRKHLDRAYRAFLERRVAYQGGSEAVSLIMFNSSARVIFEGLTVQDALCYRIVYTTGGTNFVPALSKAQRRVRHTLPGVIPNVVFMTDGVASDLEEASELVKAMHQKYHSRGFKFHAVATGRANYTYVQQLATSAGSSGQFHASSYADLGNTFAQIAATTYANEHLYTRIGGKIVEAIQEKLALEFL